MAETYKLELHASGPYVGCESTELVSLADWGYTDGEWDELPAFKQDTLLDEWGKEFF